MIFEITAISIASSVIELLTTVVTLFRLTVRVRLQRLWWEDAWAAVAMVGATAVAIANLIYFQTHNSKATHISEWISSYAFTTVVWSVRMSLLYSIIRISLLSVCLRNFMRAIGACFIIIWASLITWKTWWCTRNVIYQLGRPSCPMLYAMAIVQVTADFAGDVTLVTLSLRHFWRVKLPRRRRRMILLIFSSSAIMSMSSLLRAITQVTHKQNLLVIFANLELVSAMVVCNLLVVVTYIYRMCTSASESQISSEDDDFTTPVSGDPMSLTTVDLESLNSTTTGPLPDANQTQDFSHYQQPGFGDFTQHL